MSTIEDLARRTLTRFERVHDEVFRGDPAANAELEVEVGHEALAGDTPVVILVTPWTLNGLAFPPDGDFTAALVVNDRRYPVFAHELDELGPYRSVNLVADVSSLPDQAAAQRLAAELAEPFREAVATARGVGEVPNPSRRELFGLSPESG